MASVTGARLVALAVHRNRTRLNMVAVSTNTQMRQPKSSSVVTSRFR